MFELTETSWKRTSTELCSFSRMKVYETFTNNVFWGGWGLEAQTSHMWLLK